MVRGWKRKDLEWLVARLASDHPLILTELLGINYSLQMDGRPYRVVDSPELREECNLVGSLGYLPGELRGTFSVGSEPEMRETGRIGQLHITTIDIDKTNLRPLLEFDVEFPNAAKLAEVRTSLQIALSGRGRAWANFVVNPIADMDEWVTYFEEHGYSRSVTITKMYFNAGSGKPVDG